MLKLLKHRLWRAVRSHQKINKKPQILYGMNVTYLVSFTMIQELQNLYVYVEASSFIDDNGSIVSRSLLRNVV